MDDKVEKGEDLSVGYIISLCSRPLHLSIYELLSCKSALLKIALPPTSTRDPIRKRRMESDSYAPPLCYDVMIPHAPLNSMIELSTRNAIPPPPFLTNPYLWRTHLTS